MTFQPKNILFFPFILTVIALSIFPITDNDVWWHLKTGEYILSHHCLPVTDIFSYTIFGKPWLLFEWLAQVCLYSIYASVGLAGLTVFKALVVGVIFLLLIDRSEKSLPVIFVLLGGIAFLAMRDGLRERPQIFTYLFTALFVSILSRDKRNLYFMLPIIEIVWANMHGSSAIIGFGLTCIYIVLSRHTTLKEKVLMPLLTLLAMFVNPHGYRIFVYFYSLFHERLNSLILEYRPPSLSAAYVPYFVFLCVAIVSIIVRMKTKKDSWLRDCVAVTIAATASCIAIRNIPLFCIISLPVTVSICSLVAESFSMARYVRTPLFAVISGTLIIAAIGCSGSLLDFTGKYHFGTGDAHQARYAAEFVRQCHIQGNMFNDYDFGGYLIKKLYPQKHVFIDGRLVEFGYDQVEKSFNYMKPEVWNELDRKYHFTAAIIPQEYYYAASNFDRMEDWILVYWDDGAMVYMRKCPENEHLIKLFGYRFLRPNSPWQGYLKNIPPGAVIAELKKSLYFAPHCYRARMLLNYCNAMQSSHRYQ